MAMLTGPSQWEGESEELAASQAERPHLHTRLLSDGAKTDRWGRTQATPGLQMPRCHGGGAGQWSLDSAAVSSLGRALIVVCGREETKEFSGLPSSVAWGPLPVGPPPHTRKKGCCTQQPGRSHRPKCHAQLPGARAGLCHIPYPTPSGGLVISTWFRPCRALGGAEEGRVSQWW